jgi:hypothetical protein
VVHTPTNKPSEITLGLGVDEDLVRVSEFNGVSKKVLVRTIIGLRQV